MQQCPAACDCGGSDETAVQCENQDLPQPPKVPAQTTSLRLAGNSFGSLATDTFEGLARLQTLDLSSTGLRALTAAHLRPMRSLRVLLLADNFIAPLPDSVFQPVARSLEELDLSGNMAVLAAASSAGRSSGLAAASLGQALLPLAALRSLRISSIGLRDAASLTEQLAASAATLEELVANGNELTTVDAQTFAGLAGHARLRRVSLADSRIRSIRPRTFDHLSSVNDLDISGNPVAAADLNRTLAEMGALNKLRRLALARMNISRLAGLLDVSESVQLAQRLVSLDLSGNLITDVGNRRFYTMKSLQVLDLSANLIKTLDGDSFSGLVALTQLSLAGNRLHAVTARVLENLASLTALDLSRNQLTTLDLSAFVNLFSLVRLDVSRNYIATIQPDESGGSLEMLQELNLTGNLISGGLAELLAAVGRLRTLDASHNRITSLPGNLLPTHSMLTVLNLSSNAIADISGSSSPFSSAALRVLDLSLNRLTRFPVWPRRGGAITTLSLRGNNIATLSARSLVALGELRELDAGDNDLRSIDAAALAGAPALRTLRLDGNALGPFIAGAAAASAASADSGVGSGAGPAAALAGGRPESLLEELDLSRNDATSLADGLFGNLTHLRSLNLSSNRLSQIAARHLRGLDLSLALLDLSSNNLTRVDPAAFARLAALSAVDLSRNPFDCHDPCHTQALRRWADSGSLATTNDRSSVSSSAAAPGRPVRVLGYRVPERYACAGGSGQYAGAPLRTLPTQPLHACPATVDQADGEAGNGAGGGSNSSEEKTIILVVIGCTAFVVLVVAAVVFWQHRVRLRRKLHKQQHYHAVLDHHSAATPAGLCPKAAASAAAAAPAGAYKCQQQPPPPLVPPLLHGDGYAQQQQPLLLQHGQPWRRTDATCMTQQPSGCSASGHPRAAGQKCGTAYV